MIRSLLGAGLILCATSAFAQSSGPAFEVASIKAAAPMQNGIMMVRMGIEAGRIDWQNVTLQQVLTRAYGVKSFQISGPSWLDSQRYDISAKFPEGATQEQLPAMLQNLLVERFKFKIRKEQKEQQVYALIVGKDGPKLTKSPEGDLTIDPRAELEKMAAQHAGGPGAPPPPPPPPAGGPAAGGGARMSTGGGGGGGGEMRVMSMTVAGPGGAGPGKNEGMMMISNGKLDARRTTMAGFANMLSNLLDKQVVDKTGIEGKYDITLEASMDDLMRGRMAVGHASTPGMQAGPESASIDAPSGNIFSAVQKLGLKLDARKEAMDLIVVEGGEKVPTEN